MSDKLAGGIKAGRTSVMLPVELRKSADSTEQTGKVYTDVTGSYWRQGGTRTAITMATLSGPSAAFSSGGFVEVDATNQPGLYRLDVPDAAFATGADWVVITVKVASCFVQNFMFALETKGAADLNDIAATAIVSSGAITTSSGAVSSVTRVTQTDALASTERDAIAAAILDLAAGVETSLTVREALRGFAATLMGKSSNFGATFRDFGDTKARITATVDSNGNRTAITRDLT